MRSAFYCTRHNRLMESNFHVRINQIDHCMVPPGPLEYSPFPKTPVPVLRVYGPTSSGQKACIYIHQVYPYFYVEYKGSMDVPYLLKYTRKLQRSLNHAIALSMKRDPHSPKSTFIRAVVVVKGVPFYGFHASYAPFLKIYMFDPTLLYRGVAILRSGTVMQTRYSVYESHLSFPLQFMCDFGLYGCGWIDMGEVWQRGLDNEYVDPDKKTTLRVSPYHKQAKMDLEVDVVAHQILNRNRLTTRDIHHQLQIPAAPMPTEPLILSVRELWEDERRRRLARGLSASPDMPVDLSENRRGDGGDWTAEARWWRELRARIEAEPTDHLEPSNSWDKRVMTTSQSIEALWEPTFRVWKPQQAESSTAPIDSTSGSSVSRASVQPSGKDEEVDVDESFLSSQAIEDADDPEPYINEMESFIENDQAQSLEDGPDEGIYDKDFEEDLVVEQEEENPFLDNNEGPAALEADGEGGAGDAAGANDFIARLQHSVEDDTLGETFSGNPPLLPAPTESPIIEAPAKLSPTENVECLMEPSHPKSEEPERPAKRRKVEMPNGEIQSQPRTQTRLRRSEYFTQSDHIKSSSYSVPDKCYVYAHLPPTKDHLLQTLDEYNVPSRIYRNPHYSHSEDAPARPREYAGLVYRLKGGDGLDTLSDWQTSTNTIHEVDIAPGKTFDPSGIGGWEYAGFPPKRKVAQRWLLENPILPPPNPVVSRSQIGGPTQVNTYGLKSSLGKVDSNSSQKNETMSILSFEVYALSDGGRQPIPQEDEIALVFFAFQGDHGIDDVLEVKHGIVAVDSEHLEPKRLRGHQIETIPSELELLHRIVDIVIDLDPDILCGWEVQVSSWGYLQARGAVYGLDIDELISRAPARRRGGVDQWGARHASTFKVAGRHVLNVWRIMRGELSLNMYSFENVVFNVLRRRVPQYSRTTLTSWFNSPSAARVSRLLDYFVGRTSMVLEILEASQIVTKTSEFARVFGVDFFSVITRGSQFKVESFMFRLGKPENFVFLSPSKIDVGKQNAAECMPLIMEPLSAFYSSPLLVLDFQSLYPSIMIAYNYCYSTCLGRVAEFQGTNKFGVTELNLPPGLLNTLKDHTRIAPNGIMYVKQEVRQGLLGRMLKELLDTRVMVKQAMKTNKDNKTLSRILNARQLGLKYIANVTYGYTSATFSGRMPAVEIADSIVQSGRETLEKAIRLIDLTPKWGAQVVYGDTDSLFIYLKGRTKEQAFRIGNDIADTITARNPAPIKLKFEKVYLPCVLMAKKRYVGFKYEHPDATEPIFDAKGIETVRRDGVPAQQKMTEVCLKKLFRSQDLSDIKEYCCRSWTSILDHKVPIHEFIFAKEVRMGTYSDVLPPPPGVAVAARRVLIDPNDEPQYGDRIPYVIARGPPGSRLVERAFTPQEVLTAGKQLDAEYYITRVLIPPLERIFNLVGADVRRWYDEMPKPLRISQTDIFSPSKRDRFAVMDRHFPNSQCLTCGEFAWTAVCDDCRAHPQTTMASILDLVRKGEKRLTNVHEVCASCAGTSPLEQVECESLDCPWLYERKKGDNNEEYLEALRMLLAEIGLPKGSADSIVELDSDGTQTEVERDGTGSMTE
ncbi:DNA polymerase zeta [Pleurotus ostreatus]|nr:DNA polymerase zeta [Pleurotus ostreatus]